MSFKALCLLVIIGLVSIVNCELGGKRVLALLESSSLEASHSIFFKSLEDRGFTLTYKDASSEVPKLSRYGSYDYDHVILFAPSADIDSDEYLDFIDNGGNVLVAASSSVSDSIRDLTAECGIQLDESNTAIVDHQNYDVQDYDGKHTLIIAEEHEDGKVILGEKKLAPVLFRGIGSQVREHALNYQLLKAPATSYSSKISGANRKPKAGKVSTLVSGLQARNYARVIVSGSLDLFSDALLASPVKKFVDGKATTVAQKSGNEEFVKILSTWVFQEKGALRARDIRHVLHGTNHTPDMYTIKDDVDFSVIIEEFNGKTWAPYKADDVQVEVRRIDPFVRQFLKHDGKGKFFTTFKLPDVIGVYTFKVDYQRPAYAGLSTFVRTPVRPFWHNQYERFIAAAFPYYAGAFSMIVGLVLFSLVFLYHKEK
eukprot:TRINITY_DN8821_c0_g2_i1.p1 TRINITY_DN8821_c0_g2~~TRINITY_DN8821_c0_g2_i1.p1  ORF type:complete len:427 (+),score=100.49 TRINITY_DN8821_c0_g2_i1:198-1478(+)